MWHAPNNRMMIGLYGKNLADKRYITSGYAYAAANATTGAIALNGAGLPTATLGKEGVLTAYYGNPRQVYVSASFTF